jgi:PAS domain S-box-containing protein
MEDKPDYNSKAYQFLQGGDEMGDLIRSINWGNTSLGSPDRWPVSLRISVSIMLSTPFPMYIAWGNDYIQLYNDGYRPILGSTKHPAAMGISTRQTFAEIWHIIGPMFDGVMQGKAVGYPNFMLPLDRNGYVEDCYFDFSYSPIRDEDGIVGGVLVTVIETTSKVLALKNLEEKISAIAESEERFRTMAESSNILIGVGDETSNATYFSKAWTDLTGRSMAELLEFGWVDLVHPEDRERYVNIYLDAFKDRLSFHSEFRFLDKEGQYHWLLANGSPRFRPDGSFAGYISSCTDITEQLITREQLRDSEERLQLLADNISQLAWMTDETGYIFWYNKRWYDYTGTTLEEMQGWGWEKVQL